MHNPAADRNRRILVIDDNRAIHDDFRKIFSSGHAVQSELDVAETALFGDGGSDKKVQTPFEVDSAYQGEEGVAMVQKAREEGRPYAMAFVDIRMPPGWDGVKTTQELWKIDPEVQIVICTAYSDYSWKEMFETIGQDDRMVILKKPFDTIEALQLAHALTEKWWLGQQSRQKIGNLEKIVEERTRDLRQMNRDLQIEIVGHKKSETELSGQKAFLEAQLDSTLDGILVVDSEGRKILQNQRMIDLWKIPQHIADEGDDEQQRRWGGTMIHNPAEFAERIAYLNSHPDEKGRDEIELKDGTILDRYSTSVTGKNGVRYGRIWSFRDITDRKKMENQLFQSQKLEIIGQLAGGVAHDFNNILGAMILNLEILQLQHELPTPAQAPLRDLEGLAKRASSLTQQLLLFSQRQAMRLVRLEINTALTSLLKLLERLLGDQVTFVWVPSPQELWADADAAMIDQVVVNLCLNARDALPNGGTVTMEASLAEFDVASAKLVPNSRPGRFACLRISDTGVGMDSHVLKHLFEPFFTTKEVGKGTGLGLASSYGIVSQHAGWINVESVLGQGTSLRFYLPISTKVEEVSPKTARTLSLKGQNETILLVEDEAALLQVTTRGLAMLGYRVLTAANGEEALKIWKENRDIVDLVLTDMRMPGGMSGLDLATELLKAKPSLKIVVMSGFSSEILQETDTRNYTFLAKPFAFKALSETIRRCLD